MTGGIHLQASALDTVCGVDGHDAVRQWGHHTLAGVHQNGWLMPQYERHQRPLIRPGVSSCLNPMFRHVWDGLGEVGPRPA